MDSGTVEISTASTTLIHTAFDIENDPIPYQRTVVSQPPGANATLAMPTQSTCIANNLTVTGDCVFRITARDPTHSVSTNHTVTVYATNRAPAISNVLATPLVITLPVSGTLLSGDTSDPGGDVLSHWWSARSAPVGALPSSPIRRSKHEGLITPGAYGFCLIVVDRVSFRTADTTMLRSHWPNCLRRSLGNCPACNRVWTPLPRRQSRRNRCVRSGNMAGPCKCQSCYFK